jgi:hypothetical protein
MITVLINASGSRMMTLNTWRRVRVFCDSVLAVAGKFMRGSL